MKRSGSLLEEEEEEEVVAVGRAEKNSEKSIRGRGGRALGGLTLCSSVLMD